MSYLSRRKKHDANKKTADDNSFTLTSGNIPQNLDIQEFAKIIGVSLGLSSIGVAGMMYVFINPDESKKTANPNNNEHSYPNTFYNFNGPPLSGPLSPPSAITRGQIAQQQSNSNSDPPH